MKIAIAGTGYVGLSIAVLLVKYVQFTSNWTYFTRDIFWRDA